MPKRNVAAREHGQDRRWREDVDVDAAWTWFRLRIARRRPVQKLVASHREGLAIEHDHGAIRQRVELVPMDSLGFAMQSLGVKRFVHSGGGRTPPAAPLVPAQAGIQGKKFVVL